MCDVSCATLQYDFISLYRFTFSQHPKLKIHFNVQTDCLPQWRRIDVSHFLVNASVHLPQTQ